MTKILLVSESYIKKNSNLNDNVWGDYLLPAIREAQDMGLQPILGEDLYNNILAKVDDGTITASTETAYKTLLDDYIQPYLLYEVLTELVPVIGVKMDNLGVLVSNDEHVQNLSESERDRVATHYQTRADFYCKRMQEYLLNNQSSFSELNHRQINKINENLRSAASTGLFLGGFRGRTILPISRKKRWIY